MKKLYKLRSTIERVNDNEEIFIDPKKEDVIEESKSCLVCLIPYCSNACPLSSDIDMWIELIQKKRFKDAFDILQKTNPFPEFTGRLCHSPCEPACVNAIDDYPTSIKELEKFLADMALKNKWIIPLPPKNRTKYNIAIIGSGPAGLSAANSLNKMGHNVSVFEREKRLGGMLRYIIPEFRLPKNLIDFRINILRKEGVQFVTEKNIGIDIKAKELLNNNDALLLSTGATINRKLRIPGSDLKGITSVSDFLQSYNKNKLGLELRNEDKKLLDLEGKNIVVISSKVAGWIGALTRLKPKKITVININPIKKKINYFKNPIWSYPFDNMADSPFYKEGNIELYFSTSAKEFYGNKGSLSGLKTVEVRWENIINERPTLVEMPCSEKDFPCDLAIISLGLIGSERIIVNELGIDLNYRMNISTNGNFQTSIKNVFACGDGRSGQSEVSIAISDGIKAAQEINDFLINI